MDLDRLLSHVRASRPHPKEDPLAGSEVLTLAENYLQDEVRWWVIEACRTCVFREFGEQAKESRAPVNL